MTILIFLWKALCSFWITEILWFMAQLWSHRDIWLERDHRDHYHSDGRTAPLLARLKPWKGGQ